jgi:hypothetical protein
VLNRLADNAAAEVFVQCLILTDADFMAEYGLIALDIQE